MRTRNRQSGFTLIEAAVSLTLMSIIVGGVVTSSIRGLAAVRSSTARGEINARAGRTMSRLLMEVEALGAASLTPDLVTPIGMPQEMASAIEFRSGVDWQAGSTQWSTLTRLEFVVDENEADNGIDDDGDGLIDEGSIQLTRNLGDPDQVTVTIATGVRGYFGGELLNGLDDNGNGLTDERGLCFTRDDGVLTIRLSVESPAPDGGLLVRDLENSIRIRN